MLQQIANGLLLFGATLLGGTAYGVGEWQQRCSFKVTKRSLRDKLTIEQQSKEQVFFYSSLYLPEFNMKRIEMEQNNQFAGAVITLGASGTRRCSDAKRSRPY